MNHDINNLLKLEGYVGQTVNLKRLTLRPCSDVQAQAQGLDLGLAIALTSLLKYLPRLIKSTTGTFPLSIRGLGGPWLVGASLIAPG